MTISADLIAVSSLAVGEPGTAYPCTRFERTVRVVGPEQSASIAYRHEQWTATCHLVAASTAVVAAAWNTVRGHFCQRGERVTLTTFAGSRVLPEDGTPAAAEERSIAGYPMVEIAEVPDQSYGTWLSFIVRAETMVPIVGGGDVVEHDYTLVESVTDEDLTTTSRRGRVRMKNGTSARTWLDTNVIDPARDAANTAGRSFSVRYTQGLDASSIEYETIDAERTSAGTLGVTDAQVDDRTVRTSDGRLVRTVSGYAEGTAATTYAEAQEPAASTTLIQIRRDISLPSVPSGRVTFTYEFYSGVTDARFPNIIIYRYDEQIEEVSGGRAALIQPFFDALPHIRRGVLEPYVYTQRSTIEFAGAWSDYGLTLAFDADNLLRPNSLSKSGGQAGLRRVSLSAVYLYAEQQVMPDPLEIDAFA